MSVTKNFSKEPYPSIHDAVLEILDRHLVSGFDTKHKLIPIYGGKALDEVLFFLASNNIQHQYTIMPAPHGAACDEVIVLAWDEHGAIGQESWYSKGRTKFFRIVATIAAESQEEIEDWLSGVEEVQLKDWSVEEI